MKASGLSEAAIAAFKKNYDQLVAGVTGMVSACIIRYNGIVFAVGMGQEPVGGSSEGCCMSHSTRVMSPGSKPALFYSWSYTYSY